MATSSRASTAGAGPRATIRDDPTDQSAVRPLARRNASAGATRAGSGPKRVSNSEGVTVRPEAISPARPPPSRFLSEKFSSTVVALPASPRSVALAIALASVRGGGDGLADFMAGPVSGPDAHAAP